MFCHKCGKEAAADAKFCFACGVQLVADNEQRVAITDKRPTSEENASLAPEKKPSSWLRNISQGIVILPFAHIMGGFLLAQGENFPFDIVEHVTESPLWMAYLLWPFAVVHLIYLRQKRIAVNSTQQTSSPSSSAREIPLLDRPLTAPLMVIGFSFALLMLAWLF
jgi:hypothetical protein